MLTPIQTHVDSAMPPPDTQTLRRLHRVHMQSMPYHTTIKPSNHHFRCRFKQGGAQHTSESSTTQIEGVTHWQHNSTSIHLSNYLRIPLHGASTTSRPTKSTASSSMCWAPLRTTRQPIAAHQHTLPSYRVTWHLKGMHNLCLHAATSALPKGKFTAIALQCPLLLLDTDAIVDPHRSHLHDRINRRQNHARTQFVSTHPQASQPFHT